MKPQDSHGAWTLWAAIQRQTLERALEKTLERTQDRTPKKMPERTRAKENTRENIGEKTADSRKAVRECGLCERLGRWSECRVVQSKSKYQILLLIISTISSDSLTRVSESCNRKANIRFCRLQS